MNLSDFQPRPACFRCLIHAGRQPPRLLDWISSTGQQIFKNMPTLLPRWFTGMASIINIPILRPSLYRHEVGNHIKFTRLHLGSLALRPISLSFRNSRPLITQTPLLRTTKAYGQLLGRDFNPLAKLLLLRTSVPYCPPCERLTPLFDASANPPYGLIKMGRPEANEYKTSGHTSAPFGQTIVPRSELMRTCRK